MLHPVDARVPGFKQAKRLAPIVFVSRIQGIALDANERRIGIAIGARTEAALRMGVGSDAVVFVRYDTASDGPRQALLEGEFE